MAHVGLRSEDDQKSCEVLEPYMPDPCPFNLSHQPETRHSRSLTRLEVCTWAATPNSRARTPNRNQEAKHPPLG